MSPYASVATCIVALIVGGCGSRESTGPACVAGAPQLARLGRGSAQVLELAAGHVLPGRPLALAGSRVLVRDVDGSGVTVRVVDLVSGSAGFSFEIPEHSWVTGSLDEVTGNVVLGTDSEVIFLSSDGEVIWRRPGVPATRIVHFLASQPLVHAGSTSPELLDRRTGETVEGFRGGYLDSSAPIVLTIVHRVPELTMFTNSVTAWRVGRDQPLWNRDPVLGATLAGSWAVVVAEEATLILDAESGATVCAIEHSWPRATISDGAGGLYVVSNDRICRFSGEGWAWCRGVETRGTVALWHGSPAIVVSGEIWVLERATGDAHRIVRLPPMFTELSLDDAAKRVYASPRCLVVGDVTMQMFAYDCAAS